MAPCVGEAAHEAWSGASSPATCLGRRRAGVLLGALYLYFALYWAISTVTEDTVRPGDMALKDGPGLILTLIATAGACASLFAGWSGIRLWHRDRNMAVAALISGSAMGVLPAAMLLLVPASA